MLTTRFLSEPLLKEVMNAYTWPLPFIVQDEGDGINVAFPQCNFFFVEGMYGRISVQFLPQDTGDEFMSFTIQDALEIFAPEVNTKGYDFFQLPGQPSLALARTALERCCSLIFQHLMPVLYGDFSWVLLAKQKRTKPHEKR